MQDKQAKNMDEYIATFPEETQQLLQLIRSTIRNAAPQAQEAIKYAIPTFIYKGNLVHFAGYEKHIGFYPAPTGLEAFKKDLAPYKQGKGSVQFPLDKPLPLELIEKIVNYRIDEMDKKNSAAVKPQGKNK